MSTDKTIVPNTITALISVKDAVTYFLDQIAANIEGGTYPEPVADEDLALLKEAKDFLIKHVKEFTYKQSKGSYIPYLTWTEEALPHKKELSKRFKTFLDVEIISATLALPLLNIITPKKPKKPKEVKKVRRATYMNNQIITPTDRQPTLFSSLSEETRRDIRESGAQATQITQGIFLSGAEHKLLDALTILLHNNSQTYKPKDKDYYTGNSKPELVAYGRDQLNNELIAPAPVINLSLYEIAKTYTGGELPSGTDLLNVRRLLLELSNKRYLLKYQVTIPLEEGKRRVITVEEYRRLFDVRGFKEDKTITAENIEHIKKQEVTLTLLPLFREQVDKRYITYPENIALRMEAAYGNAKISEAAYVLREYCLNEHSHKRYTFRISKHKLYKLLADSYLQEGRKKLAQETVGKAIETIKRLGLIEDLREYPGKAGDIILEFKLFKAWI